MGVVENEEPTCRFEMITKDIFKHLKGTDEFNLNWRQSDLLTASLTFWLSNCDNDLN